MYDGEWEDDDWHGEGKYSESSGATYVGQWVRGRARSEGLCVCRPFCDASPFTLLHTLTAGARFWIRQVVRRRLLPRRVPTR